MNLSLHMSLHTVFVLVHIRSAMSELCLNPWESLKVWCDMSWSPCLAPSFVCSGCDTWWWWAGDSWGLHKQRGCRDTGETEMEMGRKKERKKEEREKEKWDFNGRLSILSNLAQGEDIFLELYGWINAAFLPSYFTWWHQLLLCSSLGSGKKKNIFKGHNLITTCQLIMHLEWRAGVQQWKTLIEPFELNQEKNQLYYPMWSS